MALIGVEASAVGGMAPERIREERAKSKEQRLRIKD